MIKVAAAIVVIGLLMQLVPLDRDNPPIVEDVAAPPKVAEVLRRACYDCHSNESTWPWYAYVAPISYLVVHDVHEGREHLNFSNWPKSRKDVEEVLEEVEDGEMPMNIYVIMHPEASLSDEDVDVLRGWVQSQVAE